MQITIDLPPDLEKDLIQQASNTNLPLQVLILSALRQIFQLSSAPAAQWPEAVLTYEGIPDFPAFESHRNDLLPLREPDLF